MLDVSINRNIKFKQQRLPLTAGVKAKFVGVETRNPSKSTAQEFRPKILKNKSSEQGQSLSPNLSSKESTSTSQNATDSSNPESVTSSQNNMTNSITSTLASSIPNLPSLSSNIMIVNADTVDGSQGVIEMHVEPPRASLAHYNATHVVEEIPQTPRTELNP